MTLGSLLMSSTAFSQTAQLRFDAIDLLDNGYQIRDSEGVGAPQFGQRQTFLLTLRQKLT